MSKKQTALHPSFHEFPSASFDEWKQAADHARSSSASSNSPDPTIAFSAINTEATLPSPEGRRTVRSKRPSGIEVTLDQPLPPEELRALAQSGVEEIRFAGSSLSTTIKALTTLNHPFRRLSLAHQDDGMKQVTEWLDYLRSSLENAEPTQGTLYLPLAHMDRWNTATPSLRSLVDLLAKTTDLPGIRLVTVSGDSFYERGATVVDELAMTLSWWVAYCDQLTDAGVAIEKVIASTEVTLAVGTDFFVDLAKFRAIRVLLAKVAEAYGLGHEERLLFSVRAVSGMRNKTLYDPDSNILRNTTEALAALLGGIDVLSLRPHDFLYPSSGDFGHRTVVQLNNILRHEAHVDQVYDPAAGSYFFEDITRQLVEKGWEQFLEFEDQGGFQPLLRRGVLDGRCQQHFAIRKNQVTTQQQVVVGANRYANPLESIAIDYNAAPPRLTTDFEEIRYTMDQRVAQGQRRPTVPLWIQQDAGSIGLINQRVNYVKDLLTSVGVTYDEHRFVNNEDFIASTAAESQWVGGIFCGTNEFYESTVAVLCQQESLSYVLTAGGSQATQEVLLQAGGKGVLGIGHPVVSLLQPLLNHET